MKAYVAMQRIVLVTIVTIRSDPAARLLSPVVQAFPIAVNETH